MVFKYRDSGDIRIQLSCAGILDFPHYLSHSVVRIETALTQFNIRLEFTDV